MSSLDTILKGFDQIHPLLQQADSFGSHRQWVYDASELRSLLPKGFSITAKNVAEALRESMAGLPQSIVGEQVFRNLHGTEIAHNAAHEAAIAVEHWPLMIAETRNRFLRSLASSGVDNASRENLLGKLDGLEDYWRLDAVSKVHRNAVLAGSAATIEIPAVFGSRFNGACETITELGGSLEKCSLRLAEQAQKLIGNYHAKLHLVQDFGYRVHKLQAGREPIAFPDGAARLAEYADPEFIRRLDPELADHCFALDGSPAKAIDSKPKKLLESPSANAAAPAVEKDSPAPKSPPAKSQPAPKPSPTKPAAVGKATEALAERPGFWTKGKAGVAFGVGAVLALGAYYMTREPAPEKASGPSR